MIGIYKITNPLNEVYIGQSTDIDKRINHHRTNCSNKKLKESFTKYGFENHKIEVICECEIIDLNIKESEFIKQYSLTHIVFNSSGGGSGADRKKIPNAIRKNFLIPMSKEKEVLEFINNLQREAIEQEKTINTKKK